MTSWVVKSLSEAMQRVTDHGGPVGLEYYALGKYLEFPASSDWLAVEVPASVGEFAVARQAPAAFRLAAELRNADGAQGFLASGPLRYFDWSWAEKQRSVRRLPRRNILNTEPVHLRDSAFSQNSIGTAFRPYRVAAHGPFRHEVDPLWYRMKDEWRNHNRRVSNADAPARRLECDFGLCFDRQP